jgi:hypothetical protein
MTDYLRNVPSKHGIHARPNTKSLLKSRVSLSAARVDTNPIGKVGFQNLAARRFHPQHHPPCNRALTGYESDLKPL